MATNRIYHPSTDGRGKWHVANPVSGTAACGQPVELDVNGGAIHQAPGESAHPICCKLCGRN